MHQHLTSTPAPVRFMPLLRHEKVEVPKMDIFDLESCWIAFVDKRSTATAVTAFTTGKPILSMEVVAFRGAVQQQLKTIGVRHPQALQQVKVVTYQWTSVQV